jgi:hypothetical protein
VDEMRAWLERILDGGREAFRRRGERYGHFPSAGVAGDPQDERHSGDAESVS